MQVVLVQTDNVEPGELSLDGGISSRVVRDHIGAPYAGILLDGVYERANRSKVEKDGVGVGHSKARLLVLDDAATRTSAQPEQRRDLLEGHAQLDGVWVFVGEVKEDGVFLEAVGHGELVGELVATLNGIALGRLARDGRRDARFGNVLADAQCLPFGVALTKTTLGELFGFVLGDLVIRYADGAPAPAILMVQAHDGMCRGARS